MTKFGTYYTITKVEKNFDKLYYKYKAGAF